MSERAPDVPEQVVQFAPKEKSPPNEDMPWISVDRRLLHCSSKQPICRTNNANAL
jgi:hypothetical protein